MWAAPSRTPKARGFGTGIDLQVRKPGLSPACLLLAVVTTKAPGHSFLLRKKSELKHEVQVTPQTLSLNVPQSANIHS